MQRQLDGKISPAQEKNAVLVLMRWSEPVDSPIANVDVNTTNCICVEITMSEKH